MVEKADAITDNMDNRYEAYAEAEAYMIEMCFHFHYIITFMAADSCKMITARFTVCMVIVSGYRM